MLILTRRRNESIVITAPGGKRIVVTVTEVRIDGKVKIGIAADPDVRVDREEVDAERRRDGEASDG